MKVKTSITLDEELLHAIDRLTKKGRKSRSAFIERAVREFLVVEQRRVRDERDRSILDANADELSAVMEDVLRYQGEP